MYRAHKSVVNRFAHAFIQVIYLKTMSVLVCVLLLLMDVDSWAVGAPIHALLYAITMITWAAVVTLQCADDSLVLQLCIFLKSR